MIKLLHVENPLQPAHPRVHELPHVPGKHLDEYLLPVFPTLQMMRVSVNGTIIPGDLWLAVILRDGDSVVAAPVVAGGGLLKTLASVAVLAAAAAATAATAGGFAVTAFGLTAAFGGTSSAVAIAAVGAAVSIGGNLLVSALLSPSSSSAKAPSQSYDPDGPQTLARSGTVIPKGYGTMRWGGNIIAGFADTEGADVYINVLVCFGFGPARKMADIQINGKSISAYGNVQYYTRLGSNDQNPIPNFNRIVNGYPQQVQCLAGQPIVVPGTGDKTQILQVDVMFPNGVFFLTSDSNIIEAVVTYMVEYAVSGTGNWQSFVQPYTTADVVSYDANGVALNPHDWCVAATDYSPNSGLVYHMDNGPHTPGDAWTGTITCEHFDANGNHYNYDRAVTGEWQLTDPTLNQKLVLSFRDGYQDFVGANRSTLYNRTTIYGLAPAKYDVRVTKYGSARIHDDAVFGDNNAINIGEQVWIHSVNEIALLDLAYPNMILLGIRALATNQLSGSGLRVTALITHGLRTLDNNLLPAELQAYEEDNPACVAADMMLDPLYGGGQWPGIQTANLNRYIDEWVRWAALNSGVVDDGNGGSIRRHVFNGVFDEESNLWAAVGKVVAMSRAAVLPLGRDYGVFVDQADDPVQMFTMGNILQDSFNETWLALDERANQIEITFADSTRYYKTDNPLVYMDPANQDNGVVVKNVRIDGKGITIPAQAWHLARYKERSNALLLRTGAFKCDTAAIVARPGNLIILQHDVPQWGWGGRTLPGATASAVKLDRNDFPFVAGTSFSLIVIHPGLRRYTGTVISVAPLTDATGASSGTQLGLSAFDNDFQVARFLAAGTDSPITVASAGSVVIQPAAGFVPVVGQAYELWDQDVLESRPVVGISALDGSVLLGTPFSVVPDDFSTYFYGETGAQKVVRIVDIRRQSEFRSAIQWIDYDPNMYVDATPVIGETSAQSTFTAGVTNLTGSEEFSKGSGSYVGYAHLSWASGKGTKGVGIYGYTVGGNTTLNGAEPRLLDRLTDATDWKTQIYPGLSYVFKVVGYDSSDEYASYSTAPSVTIAAVGVATNLILGSNFASGFTYWNITPRAGDTLVPALSEDGEAIYTVAGSPLTVAQTLFYQTIDPAKWAVGDFLMLSSFFEDTSANVSTPNTGSAIASLIFLDASNANLGSVDATAALNGIAPTLLRPNTAATVIPVGTAQVVVSVRVAGTGLNLPVGAIVEASHLLLEIVSSAAVTTPSAWADIDVNGQVIDLFTLGKSTGLRTQGSTLPAFSGAFAYASTDTSWTVIWNGMAVLWPDSAVQWITDSLHIFVGLTASTNYFAFPYFDVIYGGVHFATPVAPVGTDGLLSLTFDAVADAACRQDGRVPLAPKTGLFLTTQAAGSTGSGGGTGGGNGGGNGGGGSPGGGGDPVSGYPPVLK